MTHGTPNSLEVGRRVGLRGMGLDDESYASSREEK